VWFGPEQRIIVITIGVCFQALGNAIGFVIPSLFVDPADTGEIFKTNVTSSLIAQAILGVAIFVICLFFFADRPEKPPSATAFTLID
jgi:hypothetical protein